MCMCVLWRGINIAFFALPNPFSCPVVNSLSVFIDFFLTRETRHIISACDQPEFFKVCARNSMNFRFL